MGLRTHFIPVTDGGFGRVIFWNDEWLLVLLLRDLRDRLRLWSDHGQHSRQRLPDLPPFAGGIRGDLAFVPHGSDLVQNERPPLFASNSEKAPARRLRGLPGSGDGIDQRSPFFNIFEQGVWCDE